MRPFPGTHPHPTESQAQNSQLHPYSVELVDVIDAHQDTSDFVTYQSQGWKMSWEAAREECKISSSSSRCNYWPGRQLYMHILRLIKALENFYWTSMCSSQSIYFSSFWVKSEIPGLQTSFLVWGCYVSFGCLAAENAAPGILREANFEIFEAN